MKTWRFAIMGAGNIAHKFCDAVERLENCEVVAIASKSMEKAEQFAKQNNLLHAYDSYEAMLQKECPDGVYIAVTPNDHFRLAMLCLDYKVPVLCEKAMFMGSKEAKTVFRRSREEGVFVMEGLWSRFLPTVVTGKRWVQEGKIGKPVFLEVTIGFHAPEDPQNRYYCRTLGGGAAHDLTVYAYEIGKFFLDGQEKNRSVQAVFGETGVDLSNHIAMTVGDVTVSLTTTMAADVDERLVLYGDQGRIVIPHPHYGNDVFLYTKGEEPALTFHDDTENGFVYEIQEVMECISQGKIESSTVPHSLTMACSEVFDEIEAAR